MKYFKFFTILAILLFVTVNLNARNIKTAAEKGACFRFKNFHFSSQSLYREINQSEIKALRLSFRVLSDTASVTAFFSTRKRGREIASAWLI
jgi:hypothetical protein